MIKSGDTFYTASKGEHVIALEDATFRSPTHLSVKVRSLETGEERYTSIRIADLKPSN